MVRRDEVRTGEVAIEPPSATDAGLEFIGRITTPWGSRLAAPRQGRRDGPPCTIEVFEPYTAALHGIEQYERIEVLYWLHRARRDIMRQSPRDDGRARGAFSLRTPVRPNPIATSIVTLVDIAGPVLTVRGLDCVDGTPLLDLKPDRDLFMPLAPPQPGDFET